ncbi:hypothetical protein SAMN04488057_1054 [Cyclobacterium lianum]|uniref:Uncharacterized protein n=1 Tax=Cyclobacterium lianum TaxID=388280 RepID=A0A1M7N365_9BACT|nr:hypothetical protein [Cyclobacterium lianum]SHM97413.1 hypothetical protein SAMN04488057_1054 [Cyclobacterium lianum]
MAVRQLEIYSVRGDTKEIQLNFFDENNDPLDLSSIDGIYIDFSEKPDIQSKIVSLSIGNGIQIFDTNKAKVTIDYINSNLFFEKDYWGDVKIKANGKVTTYFRIKLNNILTTTKVT